MLMRPTAYVEENRWPRLWAKKQQDQSSFAPAEDTLAQVSKIDVELWVEISNQTGYRGLLDQQRPPYWGLVHPPVHTDCHDQP